jgi:hypothetical protein
MSRMRLPPERMAPRLAPAHRAAPASTATARKVVELVQKPKPKPIAVRSSAPVDDQYKARVEFSEAYGDQAGKTWSEPLQIDDPAAAAGKEFYWRLNIDQFRVDPLLQGFATTWEILTDGWTLADGLGGTLYDEAICNPLAVCRVVKAPASITASPRFRVVVTRKYRP